MSQLYLFISLLLFWSLFVKGESNCNCGKWNRNGLEIINGNQTKHHEFPFMVYLTPYQDITPHCGGSIISQYFVISAAHCFIALQNFNYTMWVITGEHNWNKINPYRRYYYVKDYYIHPITNDRIYPDVVLIKTDLPIVFNKYVSPICLPYKFREETFWNQYAYVMGWGRNNNNITSDYLQSISVKIISNPKCKFIGDYNMTDYDMCYYSPPNITNLGDSGSPIVYYDNTTERLFLIGIVSGVGRNTLGLNMRVTSVLNWIDEFDKFRICI